MMDYILLHTPGQITIHLLPLIMPGIISLPLETIDPDFQLAKRIPSLSGSLFGMPLTQQNCMA